MASSAYSYLERSAGLFNVVLEGEYKSFELVGIPFFF